MKSTTPSLRRLLVGGVLLQLVWSRPAFAADAMPVANELLSP
jgi:hypothetical protein